MFVQAHLTKRGVFNVHGQFASIQIIVQHVPQCNHLKERAERERQMWGWMSRTNRGALPRACSDTVRPVLLGVRKHCPERLWEGASGGIATGDGFSSHDVCGACRNRVHCAHMRVLEEISQQAMQGALRQHRTPLIAAHSRHTQQPSGAL